MFRNYCFQKTNSFIWVSYAVMQSFNDKTIRYRVYHVIEKLLIDVWIYQNLVDSVITNTDIDM